MRSADIPKNLTENQAKELLNQFGANSLPQGQTQNTWRRFFKLLKEPMLLLLVLTASIYLVMGDLSEGMMLGISAFVVIGISFYQEHKSEKALAALKELSSPRALVVRNGIEKRIPSKDLVPGDLIALHEGDRVPADGIVLQSHNLTIDESLLTGESISVRKIELSTEPDVEKFLSLENSFKIFSSTLVVGGTAFARVVNTGSKTEVGKIGKLLKETKPDELNLTKEIRQMVKVFALAGGLTCLSLILIYGLTKGDWLQAFLVGLATQIALLPEEFPVVLAIFLAMGAWRLSKVQVLIRSPGSIERLGAIDVLCVDKTGTLTLNQMCVAALGNKSNLIPITTHSAKSLDEEFHEVVEFGVLASQRDPFDPMEKAIRKLVEEEKWGADHIHRDWEFIRDYPLSDSLFAMSCVWKAHSSDSYIVAAKGAPEAIVDLCHLDKIESEKVLNSSVTMAKQGLRVLGVARATFEKSKLPQDQHDFDFEWMGLIGLEDPLRKEVPAAIKSCRDAGIRVIMMTGDYPETAIKIAGQAGIETQNSLITGSELNSLSDEDLKARLKHSHIFARMIPEQKLRIVTLLKKSNHVVGMTGDGVNDAPSLKWADIGIAMGARGTDVAREASDIVLLDDNFKSIVLGIERGRLIFNNIRKALRYIVSIHVPIAGLSILPVLIGWPLVLFPIHIVFLELIIDPACSLLFESQIAEDKMMNRPPRKLGSKLFTTRDLARSTLQGAFVFLVVSLVLAYDITLNRANPDRSRSLAFVVLALCNLGLIFANLSGGSWRQLQYLFQKLSNKIIVLGLTILLLILTQNETIRRLFHFVRLELYQFGISVVIALSVFFLIFLWNKITRKYNLLT